MEKQDAINSLVNAVAKQGRHKALANTMREVVPSIANQDFKIYGLLNPYNGDGIEGLYCGELYSAIVAARKSNNIVELLKIVDSFVFNNDNEVTRMTTPNSYFDLPNNEWINVSYIHPVIGYYDAIWAIQQAIYAFDESMIAGKDIEFSLDVNDFKEAGVSGCGFINEDGYLILGTVSDGKLASLYLGEKPEHPENYAVVRLESLLPLVGELPLGTTEIW